jgi:hypothetical protein
VNFGVASSSVDEGMEGLQALESSFHSLMLLCSCIVVVVALHKDAELLKLGLI